MSLNDVDGKHPAMNEDIIEIDEDGKVRALGPHSDIDLARMTDPVPAPSVAETLRALAVVRRAHEAEVEALEAGARAVEEREKLYSDWQYAEQMLLAISDALDAAAIGYASPEDEELPRVKDALARLKAAEQREAQAQRETWQPDEVPPNYPADVAYLRRSLPKGLLFDRAWELLCEASDPRVLGDCERKVWGRIIAKALRETLPPTGDVQ